MAYENYKEVYFGRYCYRCKYEALAEDQEPCSECLGNPVNLYSHKPVKFEQDPSYKPNDRGGHGA